MSNEGKKVAETVEGLRHILGEQPGGQAATRATLYPNEERAIRHAIALLSDPASQVGMMREALTRVLDLADQMDKSREVSYHDWKEAKKAGRRALAISPTVKCETCGGIISAPGGCDYEDACRCKKPCPYCSQPKAAQVGKVHDLKTWPGYFIAMLEGRKTFELRRDDRGFTVGDTLLLREFEPSTCEYTGRELRREITHILRGPMFGLNVGHAILSIRQSRDAGRWIPCVECGGQRLEDK